MPVRRRRVARYTGKVRMAGGIAREHRGPAVEKAPAAFRRPPHQETELVGPPAVAAGAVGKQAELVVP